MNLQPERLILLESKPHTQVNVLLVDDKLENLISLETLLKQEDEHINYILCRSGEAALKMAIKEEIALILLDVQMPEMDGYEVARLLKNNSRTSGIPIIFVTAIDREVEEVLHGFESGAIDFLFKPLNPAITKAKVKAFIKLYLQNKELQQKNQLLKEKQQIIIETQELAGIGTWEWNLEKNKIYFSETLAKIMGYPAAQELTTEEFIDTIHPDDKSLIHNLFTRSLNTDGYIRYEYKYLIQGKVLYMSGKFRTERDESGNLVKLVGYSQDVTPVKESQALLEHVFDVSPSAIITMKSIRDPEGNIVDFEILRANRATNDVIGIAPEDIAGQRFMDLFPGSQLDGLFEQYRQVVESNQLLNLEHWYGYDGFQQWFAISAVKLNDGLVLTSRDITERKRSEEELHKAHQDLAEAHQALLQLNNELEERVSARTQELEKAESELRSMNEHLRKINADHDNFIYTASHDLKAPINNIQGLMVRLKKHLPANNERVEMITDMIDESITRFKNILEELTELAKLESTEAFDMEEIALAPLLEEIKENLKEPIVRNNAHISEEFQVPCIRFSRKNLRSILHNLLSNAIKYRSAERNPQIVIKTYRSENNSTILSVQDNGLGLRKEDIPKMFDAFKRFHSHVDGTGVGLFLVKKIVQNMGGKIDVESEFGKGTIIRIIFPNA